MRCQNWLGYVRLSKVGLLKVYKIRTNIMSIRFYFNVENVVAVKLKIRRLFHLLLDLVIQATNLMILRSSILFSLKSKTMEKMSIPDLQNSLFLIPLDHSGCIYNI